MINGVRPELVDFGSWSRYTARDISPIDGISRLIFKHISVQQTATDGRPQAKLGYAEDRQEARTPPATKRCHLWMGTKYYAYRGSSARCKGEFRAAIVAIISEFCYRNCIPPNGRSPLHPCDTGKSDSDPNEPVCCKAGLMDLKRMSQNNVPSLLSCGRIIR